jgi:hypothetical protein
MGEVNNHWPADQDEDDDFQDDEPCCGAQVWHTHHHYPETDFAQRQQTERVKMITGTVGCGFTVLCLTAVVLALILRPG